MKDMEERLWDYIDCTCSEDERVSIAVLIDSNEDWGKTYREMMQLNADIASMETDEPSMAFGYKVIEGVRAQEASRPLKTTISKFVVSGIAAFFVVGILAILFVALNGAAQSTGGDTDNFDYKLPDMSALMNATVVQALLYLDILLCLFFIDQYIRRKRNGVLAKSV